MKNNLKQKLSDRSKHLDSKNQKKLNIDLLERLIIKLEQQDHYRIETGLGQITEQIPSSPIDRKKQRTFRKALSKLQKEAKKEFGYIEKGRIKAVYTGWGIGLGSSIGAVLSFQTNSGSLLPTGLGFTIGFFLGIILAGIGARKEREAEEAELLY